MPKPTFLKLPANKRQRFLRIAMREFADHDYGAASVTRIVAELGIAKGSVYQYFEDKKDLFLHLVDLAIDRMMTVLRHQTIDPDADTFTLLRHQMTATIDTARRLPLESTLLRRAFAAEVPFADELAVRARSTGESHMSALVERGRARGELRVDLDPQLQAFLLQSLATGLGPFLMARSGGKAPSTGPAVERVFDEVIAVLQGGMGVAPRRARAKAR